MASHEENREALGPLGRLGRPETLVQNLDFGEGREADIDQTVVVGQNLVPAVDDLAVEDFVAQAEGVLTANIC